MLPLLSTTLVAANHTLSAVLACVAFLSGCRDSPSRLVSSRLIVNLGPTFRVCAMLRADVDRCRTANYTSGADSGPQLDCPCPLGPLHS